MSLEIVVRMVLRVEAARMPFGVGVRMPFEVVRLAGVFRSRMLLCLGEDGIKIQRSVKRYQP